MFSNARFPSTPGPEETENRKGDALRLHFEANRFNLGIKVEDLATHLTAPAGLLISPEGQARVKDVIAIDPYRAGPQRMGYPVCFGDISGPDSPRQAVRRLVHLRSDFVRVLERHRAHHWPEDLFVHDPHPWPDVREQRWFDEKAAVP